MTRGSASIVALALVLGAGPTASPARGACSKTCQLIMQGYQRDLKRCRAKWQGLLDQCKHAENPSPANNCGLPVPTTTSSTSTTTTSTTMAPAICPASTTTSTTGPTGTTTTTYPPCDSLSKVWDHCGPASGACTCHHESETGAFGCVEAGDEQSPSQGDGECAGSPCTTNQDCKNCLNDQQSTDVCVKGTGEPPSGVCLAICP